MGIIRGGDSEYEEHEPSFEEKSAEWEKVLKPLLVEDPCLLKLSGKYISNISFDVTQITGMLSIIFIIYLHVSLLQLLGWKY